jgi:hypothetical protein
MRQLGFIGSNNIPKLEDFNIQYKAESKEQHFVENLQLKQKIEDLEKALINSELRATAFETMIEVAEKELKICIKKSPLPDDLLKELRPNAGLSHFCWLFGVIRQAYYQSFHRE